jgi:diadenosine tetraphosphatase ApaH/serine/threonine PP2A family protein phosphatase
MIAIISDIHANHDALLAVLAKIEELAPDEVLCLGDVVGYGPEPVRCLDLVRERCELTLCGNHDFALIYGANDFSPMASACLDLHRSEIMPRFGAEPGNEALRERWEFLKSLPYRHVREDWLMVHAAPRNPVIEYIRKVDVVLGMSEKISENFKLVDWLAFIGHTHQPGVITRKMKFYTPEELDDVYAPQVHEKAIINVGSVGQPRDGDPRACFVTVEEDGTVHYHRVAYDVEKTARKLELAGMNPALAERLRRGR